MLKVTWIINRKGNSYVACTRLHPDADWVTPLSNTISPTQNFEGDYVLHIPEYGLIKVDKDDTLKIKYEPA